MKVVFADTLYWVALALANDQWHTQAVAVAKSLQSEKLITTDEVLTEFLNSLSSKYGTNARKAAIQLIRAIFDDPNISVVPQTRESFLGGIAHYENRYDKEYSLTDCISMQTMRANGLIEVLTHDHHFTQEGFTILL